MATSKRYIDIFNSWKNIPVPKQRGNIGMFQYLKSNLWVLKNSDNSFGFLITDTISKLESDYKNIIVEWKPKLRDTKNNNFLKKCLIIESKGDIDSTLFCSAISSLFEVEDEYKIFSLYDIKEALSKIEEITSKALDEYEEVIGAWGEINLLKKLIDATKSINSKYEIIKGWEGVKNRTIIDLNILSRKTKIEIKTTVQSTRIHKIGSLNQVTKSPGWACYLASFCIHLNDAGTTCFTLLASIQEKLDPDCLALFNEKIKLRGEVCKNNIHKLSENDDKKLEFFDFDNVPKPKVEPGIGKIEWEAVLESKPYLNQKAKDKLINLMN